MQYLKTPSAHSISGYSTIFSVLRVAWIPGSYYTYHSLCSQHGDKLLITALLPSGYHPFTSYPFYEWPLLHHIALQDPVRFASRYRAILGNSGPLSVMSIRISPTMSQLAYEEVGVYNCLLAIFEVTFSQAYAFHISVGRF